MIRIVYNQTNRRKHGPPTLGSYTRLTLPDKNATKMQTKRPIMKLEKVNILIIIWNTYPTHFKSNHGQQWSTKSLFFVLSQWSTMTNNVAQKLWRLSIIWHKANNVSQIVNHTFWLTKWRTRMLSLILSSNKCIIQ